MLYSWSECAIVAYHCENLLCGHVSRNYRSTCSCCAVVVSLFFCFCFLSSLSSWRGSEGALSDVRTTHTLLEVEGAPVSLLFVVSFLLFDALCMQRTVQYGSTRRVRMLLMGRGIIVEPPPSFFASVRATKYILLYLLVFFFFSSATVIALILRL